MIWKGLDPQPLNHPLSSCLGVRAPSSAYIAIARRFPLRGGSNFQWNQRSTEAIYSSSPTPTPEIPHLGYNRTQYPGEQNPDYSSRLGNTRRHSEKRSARRAEGVRGAFALNLISSFIEQRRSSFLTKGDDNHVDDAALCQGLE